MATDKYALDKTCTSDASRGLEILRQTAISRTRAQNESEKERVHVEADGSSVVHVDTERCSPSSLFVAGHKLKPVSCGQYLSHGLPVSLQVII